MKSSSADIVICGAGMVGVAAAYHLAVKRGVGNIILIDERQPLSLTSNKGTEAYRNCWPGPDDTMVRFMNRSIDLLEELARESDNCFELNRRGYLFMTSDRDRIENFREMAEEFSRLGAGPVRFHPGPSPYIPSPPEGFDNLPTGLDLITDLDLIRKLFPFVTEDVIAMMHARRCGWMSARRLGEWLIERVQDHGVRILRDSVEEVKIAGNRIQKIHLRSGLELSAGTFVIAAGPYLKRVGAMLGLDLPVYNELHGKIAFEDRLGIVPRDLPLMILSDPLYLPWSEQERLQLERDEQTRWLLGEFPAGVHFRTRGDSDNPMLLVIWTYHTRIEEPVFPPSFDQYYPEILLRGLSRMIPKLASYFGEGGRAYVDGGYYCKTPENRPLIGPLPIDGAYVVGALSGFGVMASQAAGELLAAHVTGGDLPEYARAFLLERYDDPSYQALLANWDGRTGQL
jgi:sarcosine oxidase, subunit beta